MKLSDFTKEQQLAITSKGSNIIVSAGAGSGKTAVLTKRVLHFIQNENYHLDEFLILTFTKLAAGEMKERIRKALTEVDSPEASKVDFASITTFDAYALSLVEKYHFLLGISPNIRIVDTNVIGVRKRTIISEIFEEYYQKEDPAFLHMIRKYCFKDDLVIQKLVLQFSEKASLELDTDAYLSNYLENYYSDDVMNQYICFFKDEMRKKVDHLMQQNDLLPQVLANKKQGQTYQNVVEEYLDFLFHAHTYDELVHAIPKENFPRKPANLESFEEANIKQYKECYTEIKEFIQSLPSSTKDFQQVFEEEKPIARILIQIVKELNYRLQMYKKQYDVYEFEDIAKLALQLVTKHPEIKEEIKNHLKMIMIDEYQDTSLLQEVFISQIASNNVYMVGDIKQSIYRFRNAKSDIFANKYQDYLQHKGGIAINLNKNFRSRKEVLDDINYLFKQLMSLDIGKADYQKDHLIEYGNKKYDLAGKTSTSHHSTFITYPHPNNSGDIPLIEARLIANDIIQKINTHYQVVDDASKTPRLRDCQFSDFCILMDRGSSFPIYAKVFNEYQIPLYIENDENISENEVVLVLTNLLRLIQAIQTNDHQSATFKKAFFSIARSFLYQYTDQTLYEISKDNRFQECSFLKQMKAYIFAHLDLPIARLFKNLLFELEVYEKCVRIGNVEKNEKYLDTFLTMFEEMSKLDYSLDDFILYMEDINAYELKITLASTGSNVDSVRMMNIHKSKGLEFKIVYFAGLKKTFNQKDFTSSFGVSPKYGLILPPNDEKKLCITKYMNQVDEKKEDLSEKIRLLYVSLTRAKEKMIFLLEDENYEKSKMMEDFHKARSICQTKLSNQSKEEMLSFLFCAYQNEAINRRVFEYSILLKALAFPISVLRLNKNELKNKSLDNIKQEKEAYMKNVSEYAEEIRNRSENKEMACVAAITDYFNQSISFSKLVDTLQCFGYTLFSNVNRIKQEETNHDINQLLPRIIQNMQALNRLDTLDDILNPLFMKSINDTLLSSKSPTLFSYVKEAYGHLYGEEPLNLEQEKNIKKELQTQVVKRLQMDFGNQLITYPQLVECLTDLYDSFYQAKTVEKSLIHQPSFDIKDVQATFDYLGIKLTTYGMQLYQDIINQKNITQEEVGQISFFEKYQVNERFLQNLALDESLYFKTILFQMYHDYQMQIVSWDDFLKRIDTFNYELKIDFLKESYEEQMAHTFDSIEEVVVEKGYMSKDRETSNSFYRLIWPLHDATSFTTELGDDEVVTKLSNRKKETVEYNNLQVETLHQEPKECKHFRPSKELKIDATRKTIDFGTKIHFIMEMMNLIHPDYSLIEDSFYQNIVKRFLQSPLMKRISLGEVYQEYAYFDPFTHTQGVIDLMIIYDDDIDIIDYKTKNLDDEAYLIQLQTYANYISQTFHKKVNAYLYALLTGEYKKVIESKSYYNNRL